MKKMINKSIIEGILYESTLEEKSGDSGNYISGKLAIEIEENNVIDVHIYENEITKAGKQNQKYDTTLSLIGANSIVSEGRDNAVCLSVDSALALNDWYPNGQEELVSTLRNNNGFINFKTRGNLNPQATFQADMLITSTLPEMVKMEDSEDFEESGNLIVKGFIFDWAERILPVEFSVENEAGIEYFEQIEENTFTKVWGRQVTEVKKVTKVEESAFGEDKVSEFENTTRKFLITGTNVEPYLFGEEGILTVDEVQEAIAERKVYLAEKKSQSQNKSKQPATGQSVVKDKTKQTFDF